MKRSELHVGQTVELETYKDDFATVVVVDTRPWVDTTPKSSYRPSRYRPAAEYDTNRNGVAIAKSMVWRPGEAPEWRPLVVQLSKLFPVGTAAARREARDEQSAREQHARDQAEAKLQWLTELLGLKKYDLSYPYRRYGSGNGYTDRSRVELPVAKLEELTAELLSLRERR